MFNKSICTVRSVALLLPLSGLTLATSTAHAEPTLSDLARVIAIQQADITRMKHSLVPLGGVIATFPNLPGAYATTATTVADSNGFVLCQGQKINDPTSPMNGVTIPNLNDGVFLQGNATANSNGGAPSVTLGVANLPSHRHDAGQLGVSGSNQASSISGTAAAQAWSGSVSGGSYNVGAALGLNQNDGYSIATGNPTGVRVIDNNVRGPQTNPSVSGGNQASSVSGTAAPQAWSGSIGGSTAATGSGEGFSILPPFTTVVYLMRIK